ncbi:MAG: hypothetical protein JWQ40_109 [Segetibacter sp.]|nr:hypothetical protein [Segetibacter sp.]
MKYGFVPRNYEPYNSPGLQFSIIYVISHFFDLTRNVLTPNGKNGC